MPVKYFQVASEGLDFLGSHFGSFFGSFFRVFETVFRVKLETSGAISFCRRAALINTVRLPSAPWTHESQRFVGHTQREVGLVYALSRLLPDYQQGKRGEKNGPLFCTACVFEVSRAVRIARFESVSESQPPPPPQSRDTKPLSLGLSFLFATRTKESKSGYPFQQSFMTSNVHQLMCWYYHLSRNYYGNNSFSISEM